MRRNKHRKLGDSYYERAQKARMLPLPKCGKKLGFHKAPCSYYTLGAEWQRILERR